MASDKLTEVELSGILLHETKPRSIIRDESLNFQEVDIETGYGLLHVLVEGDPKKPAILTYHDIGLNSSTCFQGFFNFPEMRMILDHFCVYHINAPGQQEGCLQLPQGIGFTNDPTVNSCYQYPNMDQLADMILPVLFYFSIKTFIGFGVGAGANVLSRFELKHPHTVNALILINGTASRAGWMEWGYQKVNSWWLKGGSVSRSVEDYLLWHWFGAKTMENNHDLVLVYSDYVKAINPTNLAFFIESFIQRTDLGINRVVSPKDTSTNKIKCPVMLVGGQDSPHLQDTVDMNSRMDTSTCQWMKFDCGGMVIEEAPEKLAEAIKLFLQGMGLVINLNQKKNSLGKNIYTSNESLVSGVPTKAVY